MFRLLLLLVALAAGAAGLAWLDYERWLARPVNLGEQPREFAVERGWSATRVGVELERAGIIDKRHWFDLHVRLSDRGGSIRAGDYRLGGMMTVPMLLDELERGQTRQFAHTVIEGLNWRETMARVARDENLEATLALSTPPTDAEGEALMSAIGHPGLHPEGQFFADTYRFPKDATDTDYLARAKAALDAVLAEEWERRDEGLPLEDPYQALILASIVEKETAVAAERPRIAGVFLSRMTIGMRLQTDPTVIYGIGPSFDGNIRKRDLTTDTPYNTYTRAGLPPTPIAMVGREAIRAVLHPEATTSLYFVARGDGSHQFSDTIEEHNAAVRKYQLKR